MWEIFKEMTHFEFLLYQSDKLPLKLTRANGECVIRFQLLRIIGHL